MHSVFHVLLFLCSKRGCTKWPYMKWVGTNRPCSTGGHDDTNVNEMGEAKWSARHYIIINFKFQSKSIVSMFLRIHFEEGINSFPQIVAHLEFVTQFDCNFLAVHFSS